jgi:hypothetical protein
MIPTVKALVVHSPYAQEIASGEKPIEYRCWSCRYRGWLAIVAARRRESGADAGRCVCLVNLVDIQGEEGNYEWMLENPIPLSQRVLIPGRLGIFDCVQYLPPELLKLIGKPLQNSVNPSSLTLITPTTQRREFLNWERFGGYHVR